MLIGLGGIALAFISDGRTAAVLQPCLCDADPHPPALPDGGRVHAWVSQEGIIRP
ncbi:MAG: hypothetical protein MZV64_59970 [Ignavibacteriales bacterium]|nr:hypothetical protein [Ignavibacteriales bacterium]